MIKYYKLFDQLTRRGMKKTDLLKVISAPTIAKLSKGDIVKTDTIDKICMFLECQPSDMMEVIHDESGMLEDGTNIIIKSHDDSLIENDEIEIDSDTTARVVIEDPDKLESYIKSVVQKSVDELTNSKAK